MSNRKLNSILEKEKHKINFKLPMKLHSILIPIVQYRMKWKIKRCIARYKIMSKIGHKDSTFTSSIAFSCHLFRLSSFFQKPYEKFLKSVALPDFIQLINYYSDKFTSTLINELMESTSHSQEAILTTRQLREIVSFYRTKKIQKLYRDIKNTIPADDKKKHSDVCIHYASAFERLLQNQTLLRKYITFLQKVVKEEPTTLAGILKTLQAVAHYVGTTKAYESFLSFSNKFYSSHDFIDVVHIAHSIATHGKPELFHEAFSWGYSSKLAPNLVIIALKYGEPLLDNPKESANATFYFEKYINYVKERESRLLDMDEDEINYYLTKAVEFFLES